MPRGRYLSYWILAAAACLGWLALRALGLRLAPAWEVFLPGLAILGAAFLLSWTAEAAEMDMPQGLSIILLSLIAVLPEYAVDMYFAWQAGRDKLYAAYAAANMTGSNRLLIGIGWSAVLFASWFRRGRLEIRLTPAIAPEMVTLGAATLYAFVLPLKASLSWVDTVFLIGLFAFYARRSSKTPMQEPELEGPAELLASLPATERRLWLSGLFLFSGLTIYFSAQPFAEGLLGMGRRRGMDEFLLVQWLAPLASEAPEFIMAILFALKGKGAVGLRILLASKINQWTLLVGMLPAAYHLSAGNFSSMPLDLRQVEEILLTATQSFFALAALSNLRFSLNEALTLAILFLTQLPLTAPAIRHAYSIFYLFGGILLLFRRDAAKRLLEMLNDACQLSKEDKT